MTLKRRGPVRLDPRDAAEIEAMAGKTRRLMETANSFVEAASSFSAATTKAGKVVPISGALAFRRSWLPALLSAAAMLSLPVQSGGGRDRDAGDDAVEGGGR